MISELDQRAISSFILIAKDSNFACTEVHQLTREGKVHWNLKRSYQTCLKLIINNVHAISSWLRQMRKVYLFFIYKGVTTDRMSQHPYIRSTLNGKETLDALDIIFEDGLMEIDENSTPLKPPSILSKPYTTRALNLVTENERLRLESLRVLGTKGMKVIKKDN